MTPISSTCWIQLLVHPLFFFTSSPAAPSSNSPWRVLMLLSSATSGRLSSSWNYRKPEISQNPQLTEELGSVDVKLRLTTWKCLFLNVKYLHMGFPNRRTGTEHTATTTRTFCTILCNRGHKQLLKAWFIFPLVHLKGVDKWNNVLSRNAFC